MFGSEGLGAHVQEVLISCKSNAVVRHRWVCYKHWFPKSQGTGEAAS